MELIPTPNDVTRRAVLAGGFAAIAMTATSASALTTRDAKELIDRLVIELNGIINSGRSEQQMYGDFERLFVKYADVPTIARSTLGPAARVATAEQMHSYTNAFQGYMSRKYGKRFREFIGGQIIVQQAEPWKSHFQVHTVAELRGTPPFSVIFRVSDKSGENLFFDMLIEGISLLKSETVEIRAILDQKRGNLDKMITALNQLS